MSDHDQTKRLGQVDCNDIWDTVVLSLISFIIVIM